MKSIKLFLFLGLTAILSGSMISCQSDAKGDASDSVVTTDVSSDATTVDVNPAVKAEPAAPVGPLTTLDFPEATYDFGSIDQGEKVQHVYKFKNTGSEPLIISNAKGSCGCTVPSWPKEPIAPGDSGEILVAFDSKGKKGNQTKTVTLTANTEPAQTFLKIKGIVNAPDAPETPAVKVQ